MSGRAARMFLLQYGAERVPRSLSLRGGTSDLGWEPLYGVLVDTAEGWVLFDTGMGRDALDADETQAAKTRRHALEEFASTHELLAAPHVSFPGLGHVVRSGAGYAWMPIPYSATVREVGQ